MKPKVWWQELATVATMTGCCVAVLLVLASNPSGDEVYKGAATGVVGALVARLSGLLGKSNGA